MQSKRQKAFFMFTPSCQNCSIVYQVLTGMANWPTFRSNRHSTVTRTERPQPTVIKSNRWCSCGSKFDAYYRSIFNAD